MSKQVIGVGTAANDGTGDTERAAWIKQKLNNDELFFGKEILLGGRKPIIAFAGDSIAGQFGSFTNGTSSPIFHALMRLTHRDFYMDNSTANADGTGGYGFGIGGSPSSYLNTDWSGNTAIITKLTAKTIKPDILFVQTLQNDAMTSGSKATIDGFIANVTTFTTAALALGVQLVVLMPRPPYNGQVATTVADAHAYCNAALAEFARVTPGVEFVNWLPLVKDPSDANENNGASSVVAWRAPAGVGGWSDTAGVHPNALTTRAIAPLLVPILEQFGRPISPRAAYFRAYDDTTWPLGSWLGRYGMMTGTSGDLNGVANAGVAGPSGGANKWTIVTANGVTVTPSKIVHADGYDRQRMTLGGTASGVGTVVLQCNRSTNVTAGTLWIQEALLDFASVVGLRDWNLQLPLGVGGDATAYWEDDVRSVSGALTESYFLRTLKPRAFVNASSGTHATTLTLNFASGATPSGTVDLGRIGMWRIA